MSRWWKKWRVHFSAFSLAVVCHSSVTSVALAGSPTLVAQSGVAAPASIPELARALKYDANLIFEYVYTNIEYAVSYGARKGALGTLLDGSGNDMDQAALLVALLRTSGYTANYVYGTINLTAAQAGAWLNVDVTGFFGNCTNIDFLLVFGGIPHTFYSASGSPCSLFHPFTSIDIAHTWVSVTGGSFGGNTYVFDPSYKQYVSTTGINIRSATGYNSAAFTSSAKAGSTSGTSSIQNLNTANISSSLTGYANNLISYIKTHMPAATTTDVVGGRYIKPLTQPYSPLTSLPYEAVGDTPLIWTGDIPNAYRTKLGLKIGGIDQTFFTDQIYGHRLSIVYDSLSRPNLYVDGVLNSTGTASASTLTYSVTLPYCFDSNPGGGVCGPGRSNTMDFQSTLRVGNGYTYSVINGWDFTGRGLIEFHRRQLQINNAAGGVATSEPILGEALNVVGYEWLAQSSAAIDLNDRLSSTKTIIVCQIGVVGQASSLYFDLPGMVYNVELLRGNVDVLAAGNYAVGIDGSALEWGTLDQNLVKADAGAVSMVRLFDLANTTHNTFFEATSANWSTVSASLSNYQSGDLAYLNSYISQGCRVILPQKGNLNIGGWTGAAYWAECPTTVNYIISRNLHGGFGFWDFDFDFWFPYVWDPFVPVVPPPQFTGPDPVDLSSGSFLYDHEDISIGSSGFPHSLAFSRSYNSNNLYKVGSLGPGWAHNFSITAIINSDGLKGMGQDSPIDGAAAIAASYVMLDILKASPSGQLDQIVIASIVRKWLMDRLISNTVDVTIGSQSEQFVLLADGSYNPRLGSSNRLTLDGTYVLQTKDNTTLNFNADGNISMWRHPSSGTVSFSYDASSPPLLTAVSNGLGRALTLTYNGTKQLTAVTDNSSPARNVSYAYDSDGNLASYSDPLGNVTTFAYASRGLLTQLFYPSNNGLAFVTNSYDSLGRISGQTNSAGAIWAYYFAGYRSEEVDPYGTQHVLYYNPRGKALFDIQDYAGLGLVTKFVYDRLDRVTSTSLPEGGSTNYIYATAVNPWANNLASVVRNPKPGSPLATLTTSYTYDTIFNKPTTMTGPRGLVTTASYDPWTGNLTSMVADSGNLKARSSYTYNDIGLPLTVTDPLGVVTQFTYDNYGNRTSTTADSGPGRLNQTTIVAYNSRGDPVSVTDPRGNVTTSTYDDGRRPITTTSPATSAAPAGIVTTTTYNPDNRPLQVQQSANGSILRTTSTSYTSTGKTATTTDANGNAARYSYDLLDRLATTTDAMGRITQFTYTTLSQPHRTFNPAISITNALLTQTWTADGQRASLADANGNTTTFAYDGFDRLATTTYPGGSTEAYTYDADSNVLTRKTRAGGTPIAFAYDTLNRLITKTPPSGPVVSYTYDLTGRLNSASDNSSAIPSAVSPTGSPIAYTTSFTYDALNRPTGTTWDQVNTATTPGTASSVVFAHSYNKVNQRTGQSVSDNTWINYPAATPSTTNYTANALNQYTATGAITPTYDTNGNLTSDGTYALGYDAENRLVSASGAGNTASYAFDAQGRRKTRSVNGTTTVSVTDADNREVLEYNGATGALIRWYAYGLGPNAVLSQMSVPANTRATPVPDLLGSIVGSMDAGTGTLTKFAYQPYGTGTSPTPFGYTGQRVDPESGGLYYYRARHYSPVLGRFLQPDPIGYAAGTNLYAYVNNNPLNSVDPRGLECTSSGGILGCTTPGGISFSVPAPAGFPARIAPDVSGYHAYSIPVGPSSVSPAKLMQGVINSPTPGPRPLVGPATPQGTFNEATPEPGYSAFLGGSRLPYGTSLNPVKSYLTTDQYGNAIVVNVTEPGHVLAPGYVARYVTSSPDGSTIQNEGEGLGSLQGPNSPNIIRDTINNVWQGQSEEIIRRGK